MLSDASERILVMRKSDFIYIACSVFAALTAFFYCCTMWFSIKLPRYYPLEHTWKWVNEKGAPSQGWYGMQAFSFLAASIVTLAVYFIIWRSNSTGTALRPEVIKVLGIAVTAILITCMGYMLYHEFDKWGVF